MKTGILILLAIGFSNLAFSQIKSERQVGYSLHGKADERGFYENISKDSCVFFWEEYNRNGKITKKYDFPSDRCWKINGPWEHHYYYDEDDRIIEHRYYGGEEGKTRTLMMNFFYSYPYLNDPYKANEFYFIYNYRAATRLEDEQIDTFYLDTVNTKGMFDLFRTGWKFDTTKFGEGNFIFKEGFERNKNLFTPELISTILGMPNIKDFEIALMENLSQISPKLRNIYETDESYFCRFEFQEKANQRSIKFELSQYFTNIEYVFLNQFGDPYLSFSYSCDKYASNFKKLGLLKSYIEYY